MTTVEAGVWRGENRFSMEAGKNNSVSGIGSDANNVCQRNRSRIGLCFVTKINRK